MDYLRPSTLEDVEYLAHNLRTEDVEELLASGWQSLDALEHGFTHSWPCYTVLTPVTGKPMAMLGIVNCESYRDFGRIWLLGTNDITDHSIWFLRRSRSVLERLWEETDFSAFYNQVYERQTIHIAWLKWLGFKFINREGPFYTFVKPRDKK